MMPYKCFICCVYIHIKFVTYVLLFAVPYGCVSIDEPDIAQFAMSTAPHKQAHPEKQPSVIRSRFLWEKHYPIFSRASQWHLGVGTKLAIANVSSTDDILGSAVSQRAADPVVEWFYSGFTQALGDVVLLDTLLSPGQQVLHSNVSAAGVTTLLNLTFIEYLDQRESQLSQLYKGRLLRTRGDTPRDRFVVLVSLVDVLSGAKLHQLTLSVDKRRFMRDSAIALDIKREIARYIHQTTGYSPIL